MSADSPDEIPAGCLGAVVIAVVLILGFGIFGVSYESVPPDKIGLHYSGGPIDGQKFEQVIEPGTGNKLLGLSEKLYLLPATQRTYSVKRDGSGDEGKADVISAPSKDKVPMTFEVDVNFFLNQKPEVLREFFEDICLHNECWKLDNKASDEKGWRQMLKARLRPQLENAVVQAAKGFTENELSFDPDALKALNAEVSQNLKDAVNRNLGGPYFCGLASSSGKCTDFSVVISQPLPPQSTQDQRAATSAAIEAKQTATADAAAKLTAAEGDAESAKARAKGEADAQRERASAPALSAEQLAYIEAQAQMACASNPECTLVVTPRSGGTGVNINTGG